MKRKKSNFYKSEIHDLILHINDVGLIKHKNSEMCFLISKTQGGEIHSRVAAIETIDVFKKKNVLKQIKKMGVVSIRNCKIFFGKQGLEENIELILFWLRCIFIFEDFNKKHKLINNYLLSI